jgi:signal transduction histidine kinase
LISVMVLAIAAIALLARWDEQRESEDALDDFAQQQAALASMIAERLRDRLREGSAPDLGFELPGATILVVAPPNSGGELRAKDGRTIRFPELSQAIAEGRSWLRVSREDAGRVGLPHRTAMAGIAVIDGGAAGRWGLAVLASAERQRDREARARARLLLAVITAVGLVASFGSLALVKQRRELELKQKLDIASLVRERDARLERLDKAATLGTLAMGIAHEVSTPLGVISGRAEQILAKANGDDRLSRATQVILEQTARISDTIRAFLALVRGDPAASEPITPRSIVEHAGALVEHRLSEAGVSLDQRVSQDLPAIQGDRLLLEQALVNLLLNAAEACDRGGHVELTAQDGGGSIRLVVLDDGSGISEEAAARATEPFFTTKRSRGGSGLGLAIVTEIAKHHGGTLTLAPREPKGTIARLEIPVSGGGSREPA